MTVALLFTAFLVLLMLSVPIGISLGAATAITIITASDVNPILLAQRIFAGLDSFTLLAIPFFMLAGNLMAHGGIARRIVALCDVLVGRFTGGMSLVTVGACMIFAAMSGSAPATVTAIGAIMIPEMVKRKYEEGFSTALTATAGTVGVILPPSIPLVIYGVASGTSVGDLFIAGVIPGLLVGFVLMFVGLFISRKRGYKGITLAPGEKMPSLRKTFLDAIPALLAPFIILGGIYSGIFTPTEAAVIAIVYALIVGVFWYKEITWKIWVEALRTTADLTGLTGLALGFSMAFASFLAIEQIPNQVAEAMLATVETDWLLILMINFILLFVALFVDNISSCLILTPVLLPVAVACGMDPVHFGIMMTIALTIGFVTPPYGVNLFVASAVAKVRIEVIAKAAIPFVIAMFVCLMLVAYIEPISMSLVRAIR